MFLQFHTLTSYPATLLNRDDAGFAKRLPFGGTVRTRVSSQCLKFHWRNFEGEHALYGMDVPKSLRSRETFRRYVVEPLVREGHPAPLVRAAALSLRDLLLTGKTASKTDVKNIIGLDDEKAIKTALHTNQVTIFGAPEMDYLRTLATEMVEGVRDEAPVFWEDDATPDDEAVGAAADAIRKAISSRELKKNLQGLELAAGLDAALFGRMATSDVLARGDAAIHVAHAFTTHEQESESDYFSAVDQLRQDEPEDADSEQGAGHINSQELTSGLFYSYVVVDVPLLVSNLTGAKREAWQDADRALAAEVVRRFVHLMATVSPGAKLGSTAPYSYAQCLLAEAGTAQPRTLANAFQQAVSPNGRGVLANSYDALGHYVAAMDAMYGAQTKRRLAAMPPANGAHDAVDRLADAVGVPTKTPVSDVAAWAAERVQGGAA